MVHSDEMMALGSAEIFVLRYPNHVVVDPIPANCRKGCWSIVIVYAASARKACSYVLEVRRVLVVCNGGKEQTELAATFRISLRCDLFK